MATTSVKAWTYTKPGYPDTLKLSSQQVANTPPNDTSLVLQMQAAAVNPVDIQLMNFPLHHLPGYNGVKIPCADFAGKVLAAGSKSGFKAGDRVFGLNLHMDGRGVLTEVQTIDTATTTTVKIPSDWTPVQAAALPCVWFTARTIIDAIEPWVNGEGAGKGTRAEKRGKVVVLGGSSATGMYAVHLAKQRGWDVLASCSGRNAEFVRGMGASAIVDYTKASVAERVKAFGPAAILDCVGGTECVQLAPRYVTIVGDKTTRGSMGGPFTYYWSFWQNVRWALGRLGLGVVYDNLMLETRKEYLDEATTQLPKDKIVIDSEFTFADAMKAFERLNTGRARGKVVITI